MADDDRVAGELVERLLQRAQGVDVEVVGRLVEQQHVGALFEHLGQVDAVPLAARQRADLLLLVGADEVEAVDVGARVHLALAQHDRLLAAGDLLPDALFAVQGVPALVDVAQLDGLADLDRAGVGPLLAGDQPEHGRLARAVRADHAQDGAGRHLEAELLEQQPVVVALRHFVEVDDDVPQPRAGRDVDLHLLAAALGLLAQQLFVGGHAGLPLGLPRGATCGSSRAHVRGCESAGCRPFPRGAGVPASAPATTSSCPSTGCRNRGPAPGSTRPRCPGSSGRASPR